MLQEPSEWQLHPVGAEVGIAFVGFEVEGVEVGIEVVGAEVGVGIAVVGSEVGRGVVGFEVDGVEVGFEVVGVEVGRAVDGFGVVGALVLGALVGLVVLGFGEVGLGVALAAEAAHGPPVAQQTDAMTKTMDPLAKFIEQVRDGGINFPSNRMSIVFNHSLFGIVHFFHQYFLFTSVHQPKTMEPSKNNNQSPNSAEEDLKNEGLP